MDDIEIQRQIRAAVREGDVERVRSLIGDSRDLLRVITPFGTWLHVAAKTGQVEVVEALLEMGADTNARGGTLGGAPINLAASAGWEEIVRLLIDSGAEMDVSEPERNPLFAAIYGGHPGIVKLLIERGIDYRVNYTGDSMKNMDAVAFARERGQLEIAEYLARLSGS